MKSKIDWANFVTNVKTWSTERNPGTLKVELVNRDGSTRLVWIAADGEIRK